MPSATRTSTAAQKLKCRLPPPPPPCVPACAPQQLVAGAAAGGDRAGPQARLEGQAPVALLPRADTVSVCMCGHASCARTHSSHDAQPLLSGVSSHCCTGRCLRVPAGSHGPHPSRCQGHMQAGGGPAAAAAWTGRPQPLCRPPSHPTLGCCRGCCCCCAGSSSQIGCVAPVLSARSTSYPTAPSSTTPTPHPKPAAWWVAWQASLAWLPRGGRRRRGTARAAVAHRVQQGIRPPPGLPPPKKQLQQYSIHSVLGAGVLWQLFQVPVLECVHVSTGWGPPSMGWMGGGPGGRGDLLRPCCWLPPIRQPSRPGLAAFLGPWAAWTRGLR